MKHATLTRLGDVMTITSGFAFKSGSFSDKEHGLPLVRIRDVERGFSETFFQGEYEEKYVVQNGDLLVSMDGEFRVKPWEGGRALLNQRVCRLEPNPRLLLPSYLKRLIAPELKKIEDRTPFVTVKHLSSKTLLDLECLLPPLPEQRRIADILDKADAIRRKRKEAISTLDEIKLSQFDQWFAAWFTPQAERDYVPVSQVVSRFEGGLNVATPESPTSETKNYILKVSAVTWGVYRPDESKPLPTDFTPPAEHIVRKGDLLFSRANTTELVGATVFVFQTPPNRVLPDKLWRFVWKNPSEVEPLFVWALFNHPKIRYEIGRRATGTSGSMKNISMEKVMSIRVPWPDIETQRRFARFTMEERKIRNQMSSSMHNADSLFNSLVQRAFRGEL